MRICAIELKANNTIFCLIDTTHGNVHYMDIKEKKISIQNDEDIDELQNYVAFIKNLIKKLGLYQYF